MPDLTRGANAPLTGPTLQLAVAGARQGAVDLMVFQLADTGKVRSDADFIFFNQPSSPEGAVRLTAADQLSIDLATVPAAVDRLAVAVALDDSVAGSLAAITGLGVSVTGTADRHTAPATGLTTERAAVLVEIYRRAGAWKVRNVSAGWTEGLSGLATAHGVSVDDAPAAPSPAPPAPAPAAATPPAPAVPAPAAPTGPPTAPTSAPADGVRSVPGEAALSLVKRQKLDLRKREVAKVLLTKGAQHERARIVLVLDKTGSMADEYAAGIVHRVVERMVPVAIQLDDDGSLECYLYAVKFAKLPDIRIEYLEAWMADFIHMTGTHQGINYREIGGYNDEIPIMTEVLASLTGRTDATLVLFFTDGGFSKKKEITKLISQASKLPAFWQFVGIGNNDFGVLTKLDEMTGRTVDNVGFFPVTDIDRVDDAELYRRLLSEFPDWLRAARAAGILAPAPR